MNYQVRIDGATYELPKYNFGVIDKLEQIQKLDDLRDKCRGIYSFVKENVLKEKTNEVLGEFEKIDPNKCLIIYADICSAYREPLEKSTMRMIEERIANGQLDKVAKIMEKIDKIK